MMISVFICEDNKVHRKEIKSIVENYIYFEELEMRVVKSTGNPHEIIDYLDEGVEKRNGVYFLDINLKSDITGLELAMKIRKRDRRGVIIFITVSPEYIGLIVEYGIEAMGYITKGLPELMKEKIIRYLLLANQRLRLCDDHVADEIFTLKSKGKIIREHYKDIIFFQVHSKQSHKVVLYTKNKQIEFYASLSDIEERSKDLVRVDRSCVLNKNNVKEIIKERSEIHMINGDVCRGSKQGVRRLVKILEN